MPRSPTGPSDETRLALWVRCGGLCECCGREPSGLDPQHRDPRGSGGSRKVAWINQPSNLAALCRACHDRVETEGRATHAAYRDGWLVHRWAAERLGGVTKIPVVDLRGRAWVLTDDGRKHIYTMADYDPLVQELLDTA